MEKRPLVGPAAGAGAFADAADHDLSSDFSVSAERFSTSGLKGADRVEKWESHNAKAIFGLKATSIDEQTLDATQINLNLPRLSIHHVSANAHVIERSTDIIRKKPTNSLLMFFALYGDAFFYYPDGVRTLGPGTAVLCDGDKPFVRGFARGLKEMVLVIPKSLFAEITDDATPYKGDPHVTTFGPSPQSAGYTSDIAALMSEALRESNSSRLLEIENEIVDCLRGLYGGFTGSGAIAQFRALSNLIDRHLRNPKLSASLLAADLTISERQLSRILASEGHTLPAVLLERRLELAMRILSSTHSVRLTVAEVGGYCGFSSTEHFSRSFRARFGMPPSQVLRSVGEK